LGRNIDTNVGQLVEAGPFNPCARTSARPDRRGGPAQSRQQRRSLPRCQPCGVYS
jgi:hypothetical protein